MSRIAYVDGRYRPLAEAGVGVMDRGLQFGDSVYEVILVARGRLVDEDPHLDRLDRSLAEIRLARPMPRPALKAVSREVVRLNRVRAGVLYLQVTRGPARRDAAFPANPRPSLIALAWGTAPFDPERAGGVAVRTAPDQRWARCDIKTTALIANVLAKQGAVEAGVYDTWQVDRDGLVTEGSASNAWIVTKAGELVTRPLSTAILWGITRRTALALAAETGITFAERPFTPAEARAAAEAFLTNAGVAILPVLRIDDAPIGAGRVGPVTRALMRRYHAYMTAAG